MVPVVDLNACKNIFLGTATQVIPPVLHRPLNQKKNFEHFPLNIIETGVW